MVQPDDLFAGLDEVQWRRMRHAYGSAGDVPGLLRGLVDDDPVMREEALDNLYAGAHHQGDVYPCTVAAVPFLIRIAARSGLPDRADVIELLSSIGSAADPTGLTGHRRAANQAVSEARELWGNLLDDPEPAVRAAAAALLPACLGHEVSVANQVLGRLDVADDPSVRSALVTAAVAVARRRPDDHQVHDRLVDIVVSDPDPQVRLTALTEAVTLPGATTPVPDVEAVSALIADLYEQGTPSTDQAGGLSDTLIGAVREQQRHLAEGRRSPAATDIVRAVAASYGDHVDDRIRLLATLGRSADWESRYDALLAVQDLIRGWRGPYTELVRLVGGQLHDDRTRLRECAVTALQYLGPLAAPAADDLARALAGAVRTTRNAADPLAWVVEWSDGRSTVGSAVTALSCADDPRALPMLMWALDRPSLPWDAPALAARFTFDAATLVPLLVRWLADQPDDPRDLRRSQVVHALTQFGPAATEALPALLDLPRTAVVVTALAAIADSDASEQALREAVRATDRETAVAAATGLWRTIGDPGPALEIADRYLDDTPFAARAAVDLLAEIGSAAHGTVERLRAKIKAEDDLGWTHLSAARALWRVVGEPVPALPVLRSVWRTNPHTRSTVATVWAEIGPDAVGARDLLIEELRQPRRHNAVEHSFGSDRVIKDEDLLEQCRTALAAVDGPYPNTGNTTEP